MVDLLNEVLGNFKLVVCVCDFNLVEEFIKNLNFVSRFIKSVYCLLNF